MSAVSSSQTGHDYRIFVGAFPEGELAQRIQALREKYDRKTAQITSPHVTLAGTYWRDGSATAENEAATISRLESLSGQLHSFELDLGGIYTFPPAYSPVIYLGVEKTGRLLSIRHALLEALGSDGYKPYSPHMTLAMRLKGRAVQSMLADLHGGEWDIRRWHTPIKRLQLMQRGQLDPAWRVIVQVELQ